MSSNVDFKTVEKLIFSEFKDLNLREDFFFLTELLPANSMPIYSGQSKNGFSDSLGNFLYLNHYVSVIKVDLVFELDKTETVAERVSLFLKQYNLNLGSLPYQVVVIIQNDKYGIFGVGSQADEKE